MLSAAFARVDFDYGLAGHLCSSQLALGTPEDLRMLSSVYVADLHVASAKAEGLEDAGPSRKRARLKDGGYKSSKQPALHGGTLIVAPTAVLNQWDQELAAKASPAAGIMSAHLLISRGRSLILKSLSCLSSI